MNFYQPFSIAIEFPYHQFVVLIPASGPSDVCCLLLYYYCCWSHFLIIPMSSAQVKYKKMLRTNSMRNLIINRAILYCNYA